MTLNFIIVGTMKSGTSSLAFQLGNHQDVYLPSSEAHYFDKEKNYEKGEQYYLNCVNGGNVENCSVIGEKTPTYSYDPKVPERIYNFNPDIKLIWIFRNPVDRAYSNYQHAVKKGRENLSFEKAIETEKQRIKNDIFKGYLTRSVYVDQVKRYLEYFAKEQMLFLVYEDFKKEPLNEMRKIFNFLDVEPGKYQFSEEVKNKTILPWSTTSLTICGNIFGTDSLIFKGVQRLNQVGKKPGYPPLDSQTRKRLYNFFKPYNEELEELIDVDLSSWKQ